MTIRVEEKTSKLVVHPGEKLAKVLEQREMTQVELAIRSGISPAYVSNVIAGKKGISVKFALGLEYALEIPKTFWLNLQTNYDAGILELNEKDTITEEERASFNALRDVAEKLYAKESLLSDENNDENIIALRRILRVSDITNFERLETYYNKYRESMKVIDKAKGREKMPNNVKNILKEFSDEIRCMYGDSLSKVILYGSYARGDYTERSDVDVMILVSLPDQEIKKTTDGVSDCAFDFMLKYGIEISPIVKNVDHFMYWVDALPFYRNVRDEGVELIA